MKRTLSVLTLLVLARIAQALPGFPTDPSACNTPGSMLVVVGDKWACQPLLPAGVIVLTLLPACPDGYAEVAGLDGRLPQGTVAAHGNVGTQPTREVTLGLVGTGTPTLRVLFCSKN